MTTEKNATNSKKKYEDIVNGILHGRYFDWLRDLQQAVRFKAKIPKSFIEETQYTDLFGIGGSKKEAREAREELISEIVDRIVNYNTTNFHLEMMPDNYSRLFHALAVLQLEKNTEILPAETANNKYNAAYMLWKLDDGSEDVGKLIMDASWYMTVEIRKEV